LADPRSGILGLSLEWGEASLKAPAFSCLPVEGGGSGWSFLASAVLHALLVFSLPALIQSLPPDPDRVFQARLEPSMRSALILRMPDRIYLPAPDPPTPKPPSVARPTESRALPRTREDPPSSASSAAGGSEDAPFRPILIQPGKPIADDPRIRNLPSLNFRSKSSQPEPQRPRAPLVPGIASPSAPLPKIEPVSANAPAIPSPVAPDTRPAVLVLPSSSSPTAWALVSGSQGGGATDVLADEPKVPDGTEISVLSIASAAPRAGQLVEVPPVSQPIVAGGVTPLGTLPGSRADSSSPVAPSKERRNPLSVGTGDSNEVPAAMEKARHPIAQSDGKSLQTQGRTLVPGPTRRVKTSSGMVEFLELPNGSQQVKFPPGGAFDVVIVESSAGATIPEAERLLTGRPVHTVFLTLGTGRDWTLQYCLPGGGSDSGQAGMVVTLRPQPKVDAPFIQRALVPSPNAVRATQPALFQGLLGANGRLANLRPVSDAGYQPLTDLLPYLEQWQFRPARVDGVSTEVEVLLLVPPFTHQ